MVRPPRGGAGGALFVLAPPTFTRLSFAAVGSHTEALVFTVALLFCFFHALDGGPGSRAALVLCALVSAFAIVFTPSPALTVVTCALAWIGLRGGRAHAGVAVATLALGLVALVAYQVAARFGAADWVFARFVPSGPVFTEWHRLIATPVRRLAELVSIGMPRSPGFRSWPSSLPFALSYLYAGLVVAAVVVGLRYGRRRDPRIVVLALFLLVFTVTYTLTNLDIPFGGPPGAFRYFAPLHLFVVLLLAALFADTRRGAIVLAPLLVLGEIGQATVLFVEPFGRTLTYRGYSYLELGAVWQRHAKLRWEALTELLPERSRYGERDRSLLYWGMVQSVRLPREDLEPGRVAARLAAVPAPYRRFIAWELGGELILAPTNQAESLAAARKSLDAADARYLDMGAYDTLVGLGFIRSWNVPIFATVARARLSPGGDELFHHSIGRIAASAHDDAGCNELGRFLRSVAAAQRRWVYRGLGDGVAESWINRGEIEPDPRRCAPGAAANGRRRDVDRLTAAMSLAPDDRADFFRGAGWRIAIELADDRRRALDWVRRLPADVVPAAMRGFEAAERWWFGPASPEPWREARRAVRVL